MPLLYFNSSLVCFQVVLLYKPQHEKVIHEIAIRKNKRNTEENKTLSIEIKTLSARLAEFEKLTQSIYEDKVLGKIPENVCTTLIQKYETERTEKAELYEKLRTKMDLIQKD